MSLEVRPGCTAIVRNVNAASRTAALLSPGVHFHLPHARKQRPRILGVHADSRTSGVFIDKEHALPGFAAIFRAKDTALLLRTAQPPQGADIDAIGILRIDHNASDAAGFVETHVGPRFPSVRGLVHPVARYIDIADRPRFPRAHPHHVGVGGRAGPSSDGRDRLLLADWGSEISAL